MKLKNTLAILLLLSTILITIACGDSSVKEEVEATPKTTIEQIEAGLKTGDTAEFTESNGFAFVRALSVSDKESVAKTKLFQVAKILSKTEDVEKATINIIGPTNKVLYKVTIDRAGLDSIDFDNGAPLDSVTNAAIKVISQY
ncbi:hypothetical protein [Kurthia senegalensis]|uniref:hypothetical protein n=1 Tax=Kurthia senegalensis TaxID=1033740 RepID=UPI000288EA30|nr:hypothetical protein [Kurthia senegalensis]